MTLRQGRWLLFLSSSICKARLYHENISTKTSDAQNSSKKGERDEIKTKTEMSSLTLHQGLQNSLFVGGENVGPAGRLGYLLVFEEILKLWIKSMLRSWQWMLCSLECTYMDDKYRGTIFWNIIQYTDDKYRGDDIFKCTWIINTGETISWSEHGW